MNYPEVCKIRMKLLIKLVGIYSKVYHSVSELLTKLGISQFRFNGPTRLPDSEQGSYTDFKLKLVRLKGTCIILRCTKVRTWWLKKTLGIVTPSK